MQTTSIKSVMPDNSVRELFIVRGAASRESVAAENPGATVRQSARCAGCYVVEFCEVQQPENNPDDGEQFGPLGYDDARR